MTPIRLRPEHLRALDLKKEDLVYAAEAFLAEGEVVQIPKTLFGDSQLKNLLAIANETESPAVVTNYIRYQIGRDNHAKAWARTGGAQRSLGAALVAAIDHEAVPKALEGLGLEGVERQIARIHLVRHFLGFISRHLKYLEPQRPKDRQEAA